jgi:hypothetical protein
MTAKKISLMTGAEYPTFVQYTPGFTQKVNDHQAGIIGQ